MPSLAVSSSCSVARELVAQGSQSVGGHPSRRTRTLKALPIDASRGTGETQPQADSSLQDARLQCKPRSDSQRRRRCKTWQ